MKIEKVIEITQKQIEALKIELITFVTQEYISCYKLAIEVKEIALQALQEKLEREKGCKHCKQEHIFDLEDQLRLELKKDGYGNANYCPHCGRKLGENDG